MKKQIAIVLSAGMMLSMTMVNVQAKTRSIWVVSKRVCMTSDHRNVEKYYYRYKKSGLIDEMTGGDDDGYNIGHKKYIYNSQGHIKSNGWFKFKTNKKGLVTQADDLVYKDRLFYNKKNQLVKYRIEQGLITLKYNKKNQMKKLYIDGDLSETYQYNSKGYVKHIKGGDPLFIDYKYIHGDLIKKSFSRTKLSAKFGNVKEYTYKKIKVSDKYFSEIKRQQNGILRKNGLFFPQTCSDIFFD